MLQNFADSKCFSTLDASQAYTNIPVRENCQSMTSLWVVLGLLSFSACLCLVLLTAHNEVDPLPPIRPNLDKAIRYGLVQDPPPLYRRELVIPGA